MAQGRRFRDRKRDRTRRTSSERAESYRKNKGLSPLEKRVGPIMESLDATAEEVFSNINKIL